MKLLSFVSNIFKPAVELIDALHTSEEEKLKIKALLLESQIDMLANTLEYEAKRLEQRASIIKQEAAGESWLQRSWRPVTMLTFLALVVLDQTGLLAFRLAPEAWTLLQLGLGGYVVGRSAEKVAPSIVKALKDKDKT